MIIIYLNLLSVKPNSGVGYGSLFELATEAVSTAFISKTALAYAVKYSFRSC